MYEDAAKDRIMYNKLIQTFMNSKISYNQNFNITKIIFNGVKSAIEDGY